MGRNKFCVYIDQFQVRYKFGYLYFHGLSQNIYQKVALAKNIYNTRWIASYKTYEMVISMTHSQASFHQKLVI